MLFPAKSKGYLYDQGEQVSILSRVSALKAPLVIEEIVECAPGDETALAQAIGSIRPPKSSGYLFAKCVVNPEQRLVRRTSLDPKRIKEDKYLAEVVNTQFRVDSEQCIIAVLNSNDGTDFDPAKVANNKEVVFCGMPNTVAQAIQDELVKNGIYPESMELA
ncbi:MAG: hypothetical protein RL376_173, partial [Verrucomicrobiota bacterium]